MKVGRSIVCVFALCALAQSSYMVSMQQEKIEISPDNIKHLLRFTLCSNKPVPFIVMGHKALLAQEFTRIMNKKKTDGASQKQSLKQGRLTQKDIRAVFSFNEYGTSVAKYIKACELQQVILKSNAFLQKYIEANYSESKKRTLEWQRIYYKYYDSYAGTCSEIGKYQMLNLESELTTESLKDDYISIRN